MPQGKTRRKDDTWNTEELTHALKGTRDDPDKKKRRDDDDRKERRRHRDEVNGDDSHRQQKDDSKRSHKRDDEGYNSRSKGRGSRGDFSPEPQVQLTEEERERLRQERREKRGGKSEKKGDRQRKKDEKPVDSDDDEVRRRPRDGDDVERRRRRGDDGGGERRRHDKERRQTDDDGDRRRRHRDADDDDRALDEDERERRRQERREKRDKKDDDGRKDRGDQRSKRDRDEKHRGKEDRHKDRDREDQHKDRDKEDRHKDRDREDRHKDRDKEERRRDREREDKRKDRDADDKHRDRGDHRREKDRDRGDKDKEREERKRREREERKKQEEEQGQEEKEQANAAADDDYDYEDDFEDYEDDFEDEDELKEEGEMEEVLRALDEENARLTSQSHRSNWSDSTELSDERFRESQEDSLEPGEEPVKRERPERSEKPSRGRTFINFVSAKQRVMNQSVASKARRRANDLEKLIQLDAVYYDLFDLPPVREYELYIRSFGRSDTKQAYVQTNEDSVDRDVQTEEVEDLDKWTQHPAEDLVGCGGEGITAKNSADENSVATNPQLAARLGKFLEQAAQAVSVLIEEERVAEDQESDVGERTSSLQISDGFSSLASPAYLAGRCVEKACFCPMEPNFLLTLFSKPEQPSPENVMDSFGVICVWNVKEPATPQKVLTCLSQPTCACFSPSRAALVIAGMYDGSVMLWDLREASSLHRSVTIQGQEVVTRFPTYNTAGVLEKENHHSPVNSITAVHPTVVRTEYDESSTSDSGSGLSFQLASVEENAVVNLWVVTEISAPDTAGSEVDLGLAPGGRVKLLRSSAIVLDNPNKNLASGSPRALDIKLNPSDLNHFFVGTDLGQVIHGVRFGSRVYPRVFQTEIESPKKVTCINFSPFGEPYFLAGCEDGSVHLYHTSLEHPLTSWTAFCEGQPIISVEWSHSRPAVFFVLAANSSLYMFDLVETGAVPVQSDQITAGRATWFCVGSDPALVGGSKNQPAHMVLSLDNGTTELHTVRAGLRQPQPLETDFLAHYLERY